MSYHAPVRLKDIQRVFEMQWLVIIDTTSTSYISNKVTWIKQKNQFQQDSGLFLVIFSYIRTLSSRNFSRWCRECHRGWRGGGWNKKKLAVWRPLQMVKWLDIRYEWFLGPSESKNELLMILDFRILVISEYNCMTITPYI